MRLASRVTCVVAVVAAVLVAVPSALAAPDGCDCGGRDEIHAVVGVTFGTHRGDCLIGTVGPDVLVGRGGDDVLCGLGGDDVLLGGRGDDVLLGGAGHDLLLGGRGDDELRGGAGYDRLYGDAGGDTLYGEGEADVLAAGDDGQGHRHGHGCQGPSDGYTCDGDGPHFVVGPHRPGQLDDDCELVVATEREAELARLELAWHAGRQAGTASGYEAGYDAAAAEAADVIAAQDDAIETLTSQLDAVDEELAACAADLGSCHGELTTCDGALGSCGDALTSCDAALGVCQSDLTISGDSLAACEGELVTCGADVVICGGDLATCQGELSRCGDDVTTCDAALGSCEGELTSCDATLGVCQSDLSTTDAQLASCQSDLATTGATLSTCEGDLGVCEGDLAATGATLSTCEGDLGVCEGDLAATGATLSTCEGDLGVCEGDLATTSGTLSTCEGDLGVCEGDLATTSGTLSTCEGDLGSCEGDLATTSGTLSTCEGDLGSCEGDLATTSGTLSTCEGDLSTCQADLAACQPAGPTCGAGTVERDGACVTRYDQPLDCTPTWDPTEICDGFDNDCDGVVDNGCGLEPPETPDFSVTAYACVEQAPLGNGMVVRGDGALFYQYYGAMYLLTSSGVLIADVTPDLPENSAVVRTPSGRIFVGGAAWSNGWKVSIAELDPATGLLIDEVYAGSLPGGVPGNVIAADDLGRVYVTGGGATYRVAAGSGPTLIVSQAADTAAVSPDGSVLYLAGLELEAVSLDGAPVPDLDQVVGTPYAVATAPNGDLYVYALLGNVSACTYGIETCEQGIWRYPGGQNPAELVLPTTRFVEALAVDPSTGDVVVMARNRLSTYSSDERRIQPCTSELTAVYRFDPLDPPLPVGPEFVEHGNPDFEACGPGTTPLGTTPEVECVVDACLFATTCGAGTAWVGGVCESAVDCEPGDYCGSYTTLNAYGTECIPEATCTPGIASGCAQMRSYCADLCATVIDPGVGWGPCLQACYASSDYCEDNFVP